MTTSANCSLVYLDVGSNIGDSLSHFAHRRPEARLHETLRIAAPEWQPAATCAYGFEPSPQHTPRLQMLQRRLAPEFARLEVYTETAVGAPEQLARPMWLVESGKNGVGTHLTAKKPPAGAQARTVTTLCLSSWLRDVCAPRHGAATPVVMRLDVEGVEYDLLSDLATSGVGRHMDLYLTLEWHRSAKVVFLGEAQRQHMAMLDMRFGRYPNRCFDGSCPLSVGDNSTLEAALEKTLAFMLHRAGITYVDAYFDLQQGRKVLSEQAWGATRERWGALQRAGALARRRRRR
jgi:hypothetical protein